LAAVDPIRQDGINRTTVQRMTASLRAEMRARQRREAAGLLQQGLTKAEVARRSWMAGAWQEVPRLSERQSRTGDH
jgi:hypothetical protein